jgi:hypothetical protein
MMIGLVAAFLGATVLATARRSEAQSEASCASASLTQEQQTRRAQAIQLARAINTGEARARTFVPLDGLGDVVVPDGFSVQLIGNAIRQTDAGSGYIFTIKDTRDRCKLALFSDQSGLIYVAEPLR